CLAFTGTSPTATYTLSLHDALPISRDPCGTEGAGGLREAGTALRQGQPGCGAAGCGGNRVAGGEIEIAEDFAYLTGAYLALVQRDRKSTRLNSSHVKISYAVFCLKK